MYAQKLFFALEDVLRLAILCEMRDRKLVGFV